MGLSRAGYVGVAAAGAAALLARALLRTRARKDKPAKPDLAAKFAPRSGLTFYYFPRSPCARRVWLTLIEKALPYHGVMVNLMAGEQRSDEYLAINPQGKVPVLVVRGHATLPDCTIYESQAICTFLDEAFPESKPLYPSDLAARTDVEQWQQWELGLAEEVWPLSRQQLDGCLWRFEWSRTSFFAEGPPAEAAAKGDAFYAGKCAGMYRGRTRERNSQLQRLIPRPFSTRFG